MTSRELGPGVKRVLLQIGHAAHSHMKTRYLSGNPLKPQSGKLRSNWQVRGIERGSSEFLVVVGTNTAYAAAQNYGVKGTQMVKAHTRRRRASRGGSVPKSQKRKLLARGEARAASQHRAGLNASAQASHGMSKSQLNVTKRQQRVARGIQRGAFGASPQAAQGMVSVRAHGRFMKLRGHHYVERTLRDIVPLARKLLERFQRGLMDGKART